MSSNSVEDSSVRHDVRWIALLTTAMESVTCLFRFGFGLESTRDTTVIARFTGGIRIHHGYVGAVMVLVASKNARCRRHPLLQSWVRRVGWAMIVSDLIHHFLVLWPITGDPQFDLMYPTVA